MNKNKLKEMIREIVDRVLNEKTYGDTNEATAAQLRYAVKPKPKQSDFRKQIIAAKKMFDAGATEKEVKAKFPQEVINAVNSEASLDEANAPAPSKPSPGPAVAPGKPDTGKPKPRRPLGNPDVKPAPKAMNEEEMLQKIVARFKSKNKEELKEASSKVELTKQHQDQISDLSTEQKKKLASDLADAATEVNDKDFKTKAEYAKAMKDAKTKVYKKYINL